MDYKKIYDALCNSRKHRLLEKEIGYEIHHILPRSMGGTDEDENLVKLTYREHFIAHLLLAKAYPSNIHYRLATMYFLRKPEVVGSRTYDNLKSKIDEFKRFQKYLHWSEIHRGRIKLSSFYDVNSKKVNLRRKEREIFKSLLNSYNISLTKKNLQIHEEVFKVLCVVKSMGYKGVYSWVGDNKRSTPNSEGKYAFNKLKKTFITLGVIDKSGDFINDKIFNSFKVVDYNIQAILTSNIETRLAIKGTLNKWNFNNKDKLITSYKSGSRIVLEPVTPFLKADFKYSLEIFKPITYRKAKEILEYLLENH